MSDLIYFLKTTGVLMIHSSKNVSAFLSHSSTNQSNWNEVWSEDSQQLGVLGGCPRARSLLSTGRTGTGWSEAKVPLRMVLGFQLSLRNLNISVKDLCKVKMIWFTHLPLWKYHKLKFKLRDVLNFLFDAPGPIRKFALLCIIMDVPHCAHWQCWQFQ